MEERERRATKLAGLPPRWPDSREKKDRGRWGKGGDGTGYGQREYQLHFAIYEILLPKLSPVGMDKTFVPKEAKSSEVKCQSNVGQKRIVIRKRNHLVSSGEMSEEN